MTEHIARLLVEFQLANTEVVPPGWVVRVLARCGIPYAQIWDVFHQMYESQVCNDPGFIKPNSHFFLPRSPRSAHNQLSKYSQRQSACFSRIGWRRKSALLANISLRIASTLPWSCISKSWKQGMLRRLHGKVMNAFVGSLGDPGNH